MSWRPVYRSFATVFWEMPHSRPPAPDGGLLVPNTVPAFHGPIWVRLAGPFAPFLAIILFGGHTLIALARWRLQPGQFNFASRKLGAPNRSPPPGDRAQLKRKERPESVC